MMLPLLFALPLYLDVFTYSGYFTSLTHIPMRIYLIVSLLVSAIFALIKKNKIKNKDAYIGMSLITLLYLFSLTIEGVTHQGYMYELARIRPESLLYASLASLSALLVTVAQGKNKVERGTSYLLLLAITYYFLRLTPIVSVQAVSNTREIIRSPLASYDHKMELTWGSFYSQMKYIVDNTPEDSVIAIPHDTKTYPLLANAALVRYFLYPREIVGFDGVNYDDLLADYVVIDRDYPPSIPEQYTTTREREWGLVQLSGGRE